MIPREKTSEPVMSFTEFEAAEYHASENLEMGLPVVPMAIAFGLTLLVGLAIWAFPIPLPFKG